MIPERSEEQVMRDEATELCKLLDGLLVKLLAPPDERARVARVVSWVRGFEDEDGRP